MTRDEIKAKAKARKEQLLQFRAEGKTDREIAQIWGISEARVAQLRAKAAWKGREHSPRWDCWCRPALDHTEPDGVEVWLHKMQH